MNESNGWQLLSDGPEAYEKFIVPAFSGVWAKDLVKQAALQKNERVLDAGCGTGIVARYAKENVGKSGMVVGVDVNASVIRKACQISDDTGNGIEYRQSDICALPFSDQTFDAVLCQQGLQYFSNREQALKEMWRVLTPGGRLVLSVWRPIHYFPFYIAVHKALDRYVNAEAAAKIASAFALGDVKQLRTLGAKAGLENIHIRLVIKQMQVPALEDFFWGGMAASPFAESVLALNDKIQNEMLQSIQNSLLDYIDDDGLTAPMESYVLTARK